MECDDVVHVPPMAPLKQLRTPGDLISADSAFMRGHGTFLENDKLHASVAGVIQRVNKLISVKPLKSRYNGDIGDVVVGRIVEVGQKRWKVEVSSRLDAVLLLSSLNLPGGELRRKCVEDEMMMRDYLQEGDLVSAEVQNIFQDGSLSLHTRSLRYGKLAQGILVQVSPSLIKRRKTHFHNLSIGASIILGCNGYVFIGPVQNEDDHATGGFVQNLEAVPRNEREVLARLHNVVMLMGRHNVLLYDTSILEAFEASAAHKTSDLQKPEVGLTIIQQTRQRLEQIGYD